MISKIAALLLLSTAAHASPDRLSALVREALTEKIADAEIRIPSLEKITHQTPLSTYKTFTKVRLVEDRANGVALLEVSGMGEEGTEHTDLIQTPFTAWKKALVPIRRIYPNSKIKNEDFKTIEVNVATGSAREYRGIMVQAGTDLLGMQTRQTLLENQFLVTSAIERQPDIKKGEMVRLDLTSGDLTLTTQGTANESASVGERVRVSTMKGKKEVLGILKEDHSVEVKL